MVDRVELIALDINRSRCGNSIVIMPCGCRSTVEPRDEVVHVGTWARTLLPRTRSARIPARGQVARELGPKNRQRVGIPFSTATAATLAAGSIPSTGMPRATKC